MADLSKVKVGSNTYNLKDATARSNLSTLIGNNQLKALGTAAFKDYIESIAADTASADLPTAAAVKDYVNSVVQTIPNFDVVVDDSLPTASEDTFHKIYLIQDAKAYGTYIEHITIRSGSEGAYTYQWEQIGSTQIDLSGYVQTTRKVAGIALSADISASALETALGLKELAKLNLSDLKVVYPGHDINTATATYTPEGNVVLNDFTQTPTPATLTHGDYTPSGSITGEAIKGGSVSVTLKDATGDTEAHLNTEDYTPTGTVSVSLSNASFNKITSVGEAPSFSEGEFTPASIAEGFFSAGSQASYSHTGFSGGSLGDASTSKFVKKFKNGNWYR